MLIPAAFRRYGVVCASHSWEVIFATLGAVFFGITTVSFHMSLPEGFLTRNPSPFNGRDDIWGPASNDLSIDHKIDVIFLYLTRCAAIIYLFYQFQSLRKMGPRYVTGAIAFFILLAIFSFFVSVTSLLGLSFGTLSNALPFFLLLMDLHKASNLAIYIMSSETREELVENVGEGMRLIGPSVLLDTIVEVMVFSAASLSSYGLSSIESICCFGTVSAVANFVVFIGIFPPFLAVMTDVSISHAIEENAQVSPASMDLPASGRKGFAYQLSRISFSSTSQTVDERPQKSNPVVQRIKVVMVFSLALIHLHSYLNGNRDSDAAPDRTALPLPPRLLSTLVDLSDRVHLSPEQVVSLVLGVLLVIRFHFEEADDDVVQMAIPHKSSSDISTSSTNNNNNDDSPESSTNDDSPESVPIFQIGEFEGCVADVETQTDDSSPVKMSIDATLPRSSTTLASSINKSDDKTEPPRSRDECLNILDDVDRGASWLTDEEILSLVDEKKIPAYNLEKVLKDAVRGVKIRRLALGQKLSDESKLSSLPYENFDYSKVMGVCCENVVGYVGIPVGVVGPLNINGMDFEIPLATLEGALVASTNRGCKALTTSGGVTCRVLDHGMTRGPLVAFGSVAEATEASDWLKTTEALETMRASFGETTRFGRLESVTPKVVGRMMFLRFKAHTGDAMGMNMISKGTEECLKTLRREFPDVDILAVSGNYCVDKKPSALNWIEGRGWSVSCEAVVSADVVRNVLKTSPRSLVELNVAKNLVGSAVSGSIGGFNAHAANIVTALFLATGQDAAQSGTSSNCLTFMELTGDGDLYVSVTMPTIECGTVGGGTSLAPQSACLDLLGLRGASRDEPGKNAGLLAQVVASTVMAGELSLMAALAAGHLVESHMKLNRSSTDLKKEAEIR